MSSIIDKKNPTIYNPALRFAFKNITTEDFSSAWNSTPITVKAGQTVELPHYLADKMTDELVDKIMIGEAKLDEMSKNQPYYRSPQGSSLGIPAARKVWEDQIVKQIEVDPEEPQFKILASEIRSQLEADIARSAAPVGSVANITVNQAEFSEIKGGKVVDTEPLQPQPNAAKK